MMRCKEYIFRLTSGQLDEATGVQRFWAAQHRLMCRSCRAFTHNDRQLDQILDAYRAQWLATPTDSENAAGQAGPT